MEVPPGFGPTTALALLLPLTFRMDAVPAFIMLAGIYYGAHHAGSTTAITLNMPGEPSSIVICLDGHPMARQGRAGPALCTAAISAFAAGCISIVVVALFSRARQRRAQDGATGILLYGSACADRLIRPLARVFSKTMAMAALGMLLGVVGTDVISGERRFTFGNSNLADGIDLVPLAVGLFAFSEIVGRASAAEGPRFVSRITGLIPTRADLVAAWKPILRGTALGGLLGMLPGTGPMISAFASYSLERRLARRPERFGKGAIEEVAGPEAADNAAALTHFVPMLTLGIPAGAPMALMLGALMIQGITPGPLVMVQHADLFWGSIASMWLGNAMLLILNLPLVGIWVRLLTIPYRFLYPCIVIFCCIGAYSVRNSTFDVEIAALIGAAGYLLHLLDCHPASLILGFILGPIFEQNLRRALLISQGNLSTFIVHPISAALLAAAAAIAFLQIWAAFRIRPVSPMSDPGVVQ